MAHGTPRSRRRYPGGRSLSTTPAAVPTTPLVPSPHGWHGTQRRRPRCSSNGVRTKRSVEPWWFRSRGREATPRTARTRPGLVGLHESQLKAW
jgi:hypothetical protein